MLPLREGAAMCHEAQRDGSGWSALQVSHLPPCAVNSLPNHTLQPCDCSGL